MATAKKTDTEAEGAAAKSAAEKKAFSKAQYLSSKKYKPDRDLLAALLADGKPYTRAEVDALLKQYKEKKVK